MAIQTLAHPILFSPMPQAPVYRNNLVGATMDAAGESSFAVGHIRLSTGVGTTKTLSSAGGKIHWRTGAVTFANGSSNLRLGVQDVTASGVNDDTWTSEPQADLVGGTDTITANTVMSTAIESGSRNITHGDFIAIGAELTARGGADSIVVATINAGVAAYSSHGAIDTGSGPALQSLSQMFTIEFDDGTIGTFDSVVPHVYEARAAYGTGSNPDEYALVVQFPFTFQASGLYAHVANVVAADDFELLLYTDPLGSPSASKTLTFDSSLFAVTSGNPGTVSRPFTSTDVTIAANTLYGIAIRPSTANTLSHHQINLGSGNANLRRATQLGTSWSGYSRDGNSGAFGSEETDILPVLGIWAQGFDDGAGSGGGGGPRVIGAGF